MVPDKFNIVDFGGFDLAGQYGQTLPGIYDKIVGAHWNCVYIMCFGLKFADFDIAPQFMIPTMHTDHIELNGIISIDRNDVITVPAIEPSPAEPVILPLSVSENGIYSAPEGVDGYNPVTANVEAEIMQYQVEWDSSIVSSGASSIVYDGHFATLCANINLSIALNSMVKIGEVPENIKPCGVYPFSVGNGGTQNIGHGYVDIDGSIYLSFASTYCSIQVAWLVPEETFPVTYKQSVFNSVRGEVSKSGSIIEFSLQFGISVASAGWAYNCFSIGAQLADNISPICQYSNTRGQYADCNFDSPTSGYNIFIDPRFGSTLLVRKTFKI